MPKKISNGLVTLSSAAILAIYAAGYERTGPAADRFAAQIAQRRAPAPIESRAVTPAAPPSIETPMIAVPSSAPKTIAAVKTPQPSPHQDPAATPELPVTVEEPTSASTPVAGANSEPNIEPAPAANAPAPVQYKDGVYLGWGYSRHGNIQAFVRIEGGRIIHAGIERCETRWSCDLVAHLPGQVIARQSAEVDFVTGATQSGDAFYGAIFTALAKAK